jgi:OmpA-OmpF porin, OOP family
MKKLSCILLASLVLSMPGFTQQDEDLIQNPTLGVHFVLNDFQTAANIRTTSMTSAIANKSFGRIKDMIPGLAINYIQGLSSHVDFTSTLAGSFLEYPFSKNQSTGNEEFLMEADASIRAKMVPNKYWFIPYVQIGVGASKYGGYWGAFIPAGLGLQISFFNEAFLLINTQYRIPVTEAVCYHFYHSIGLAGTIGKRKTR